MSGYQAYNDRNVDKVWKAAEHEGMESHHKYKTVMSKHSCSQGSWLLKRLSPERPISLNPRSSILMVLGLVTVMVIIGVKSLCWGEVVSVRLGDRRATFSCHRT